MRAEAVMFAACLFAGCVAGSAETPAPPAPTGASSNPQPTPTLSGAPPRTPLPTRSAGARATATPVGPATAAPTPPWARNVHANLECDGSPLHVGGNEPSGQGGHGSAQAAVQAFLREEARFYAWLPLRGYEERATDVGWALWVHEVDGETKGAFIAASLSHEGWQLVGVAACDPAELAPGEHLALDLVIWTDGNRRVPTKELTERADCHAGRILRVNGQLFARAEIGDLSPTELMGTFAASVPVPADARATRYEDGARRLWIAGDRAVAYVGAPDDAERWPRVVGDEIPRIDCG
jgi:hypothetical protein